MSKTVEIVIMLNVSTFALNSLSCILCHALSKAIRVIDMPPLASNKQGGWNCHHVEYFNLCSAMSKTVESVVTLNVLTYALHPLLHNKQYQ